MTARELIKALNHLTEEEKEMQITFNNKADDYENSDNYKNVIIEDYCVCCEQERNEQVIVLLEE